MGRLKGEPVRNVNDELLIRESEMGEGIGVLCKSGVEGDSGGNR